MPLKRTPPRRICFVTGTRAEFGLMSSTLRAIQAIDAVQLQLVVTGMHLHPKHGQSIRQIQNEGWKVDAVVPWEAVANTPAMVASEAGRAMAGLAEVLDRLDSEIVLVVGDRAEAFAAASAGHIGGRIVAHVHGGDRALGQVDDSLRHAITKLAHLHFPATAQSAERIRKLGEDRWRVHRVGSPGIDGIIQSATPRALMFKRYGWVSGSFALVVLHPTEADDLLEEHRAKMLLRAIRVARIKSIVAVAPNNDPGSTGILRCWENSDMGLQFHRDLPRADFLGLLRDTAVLIGNSSSGIIEAASFGTPVIDVGDRQKGRERGPNVRNVPFQIGSLQKAISAVWNRGVPARFPGSNVYGDGATGEKIANILARVTLDDRLRRKLIAY